MEQLLGNINANIGDLLELLRIGTQRISFNDRKIDGGRLITAQNNNILYCMYNHPTRQHSAAARVVH